DGIRDGHVTGVQTCALPIFLADYPYPVEKRLDVGKYALTSESERNDPRKFQVQYGETDFNFIQRLMEEWGIYWFFEHSDGKHRQIGRASCRERGESGGVGG